MLDRNALAHAEHGSVWHRDHVHRYRLGGNTGGPVPWPIRHSLVVTQDSLRIVRLGVLKELVPPPLRFRRRKRRWPWLVTRQHRYPRQALPG